MDVTIRTADLGDIQSIMDFSKALLRKMSLDELRTWMGVDPEGFFVAEDAESKFVGNCCAIRLSPEEGFVGLFWVAEAYRRSGLGSKLLTTAVQHLGDRNVGLWIEKEMSGYFSKHGFTYEGDKIMSALYECPRRISFPERRDEPGIRVMTLVEGQLRKIQNGQDFADEIDADLEVLTAEDIISKVEAYDKSLRSVDLSSVIREMFFWRSCRASVVFSSDKVVGFGCLRPVITGHWILSPLYADTECIAEIILTDLLQGIDFSRMSKGVLARFPEKNTAGVHLLKRFGFQFSTAPDLYPRFNKRSVSKDCSKIYSIYNVSFSAE